MCLRQPEVRLTDRAGVSGVMWSMWTVLWAAVLPSVILASEVDWRKLDGLARAKVEVREGICSTVIVLK